jgi:hypothetical protein
MAALWLPLQIAGTKAANSIEPAPRIRLLTAESSWLSLGRRGAKLRLSPADIAGLMVWIVAGIICSSELTC